MLKANASIHLPTPHRLPTLLLSISVDSQFVDERDRNQTRKLAVVTPAHGQIVSTRPGGADFTLHLILPPICDAIPHQNSMAQKLSHGTTELSRCMNEGTGATELCALDANEAQSLLQMEDGDVQLKHWIPIRVRH